MKSELFPNTPAELLRLVRGIIITIDHDWKIHTFYCSDELSFFDPGKISGRYWYDIFISINPEMTSKAYLENISGNENREDFVTRIIDIEGAEHFFEWKFTKDPGTVQDSTRLLGLGVDISQRIIHENQLLKERFDLIERNKELVCLYGIAQIMSNVEMSFEEKIKKIAVIVPQAFQFSETAYAKICFDDQVYYSSKNFIIGDISAAISERIFISGTQRGHIEVFYTDADKNSFLKEEQNLLRTVAHQLAMVFEKKEADEKQDRLTSQLRHSDRLAKIGQLAAGIAHELNNPLGNILGYAQLSAKSEDLPLQAAEDLDRIIQISLHAREIIKKLMLFSRQMPSKIEPIDLNLLLDRTLNFLDHICRKSRVKVVRDFDENLKEISADRAQIVQVVMNLVMNAVQAMDKGGKLIIKSFQEPGHVCFAVKDTGTGMDQETLKQIFMPFFTTKDVDQGTGLGLSVVHGILETHGAFVTVSSQKGHGTEFVVKFIDDSQDE